jgi:uncharacterized damage-inducible protein DinB
MQKDDVEVLVDYLYWMRDRVLTAAERLEHAWFVSPETVTTRDLRATLVHELDVEWSWRERLSGAPSESWGPDVELKPRDYPSLEAVADHWRRDEAEMRAWVDGLTDADLTTPAPSEQGGLPLWYYVMHLVSHASQQLSDAATLLTRAGNSPGDIDFLEFAEQRQARTAATTTPG